MRRGIRGRVKKREGDTNSGMGGGERGGWEGGEGRER